MNISTFSPAAVFLIILELSTRVKSSMICYACGQQAMLGNAIINSRCGDPFESDANATEARSIQILNCEYGCSKFKTKVEGRQLIIRGCALTSMHKEHCRDQRHHGMLGEMCQCTSDRCNTASRAIFSVPLLVLITMPVVLLV